jgi:hypothetical protein
MRDTWISTQVTPSNFLEKKKDLENIETKPKPKITLKSPGLGELAHWIKHLQHKH